MSAAHALTNRPLGYKKSTPRKTNEINDSVIILRNAIFTPSGRDKDVTEGIAPQFLTYCRNELNLKVEFSAKLTRAEANWAFDLTKTHMEDIYENSGYGWDDEDKMRELTEQGARFLLVRENSTANGDSNQQSGTGALIAFVHFRFTVQGEVMDMMAGEPCLYVWDIQIEKNCQRKGLGRHMITLLELIARREKMSYLSIPIQNSDARSMNWILKLRGFKPDFELNNLVGFDNEIEGFNVISKNLKISPRRPHPHPTALSPNRSASESAAKEQGVKLAGTRNSPVSVIDAAHEEGVLANADCAEAAGAVGISGKKLEFGGAGEEAAEGLFASVEEVAADEGDVVSEGGLELTGLSEQDVVDGLRVLFREKNGREVTEDEVQQWLRAIRETEIVGDAQE